MNTSIQDFENLFASYNNYDIDSSFIILNYDNDRINEYERVIVSTFENDLNKKIEIIVISENADIKTLNSLQRCWDKGFTHKNSAVKVNHNLKIVSINLKEDINIHFKILLGIKNAYANSQEINIINNDEDILNVKLKIPVSELNNYNQFIVDKVTNDSYLIPTNLEKLQHEWSQSKSTE